MRGPFQHILLRRLGSAVVALALTATVTAAITGTARAASAPAVPALSWQPCNGDFECATAAVPLDYDDPQGRTINIAMIRRPAADPANRIGSVFFNPGGPGGLGTTALPLYYTLFPAQLRDRFDIVSFDPRGVGESTAVQCYPSLAAQQEALAGLPVAFPVGQAQRQTWIRIYAEFGQACRTRVGALLSHLSTADVARDMDLMRQAVGDRQLNYLGVSYGSFLGATYANLFPGKVRALVLDGNIDPVAAATGRGDEARRLAVTLRFGQDEGMAATLRAFLRLCGAADPAACAFSAGDAAATRDKYATLLQRLRQDPVTIGAETYTYDYVTGLVGQILYGTQPLPGALPGWTGLATFLQQLWTSTSGPQSAAAPSGPAPAIQPNPMPPINPRPVAAPTAPAAEAYPGPEQQFAVTCSDTPNPRDPGSYPAQAAFAFARSGAFGLWRTWAIEPCATWPVTAADRYVGPWNKRTANPILVVNITTDPGTPYPNAVSMVRLLDRARLLTVDGYGHTAFLNKSACADAYESAYFIDGTLPPAGTTCRQDRVPFS
jgi:pimeloyl-ACP methyl ester carboxylesterase